MSSEDDEKFHSSNKCWICNKLFDARENKVRDHDHVTGNIEVLQTGVVTLILNWLKSSCNIS